MKSIFKFTLAASVALLLAAGCSKSDGSSDSTLTPIPNSPAIGKSIDGYLVGATVFEDCNDNKKLDVTMNEPNGFTDANGNFSLNGLCASPSKLIAYGGTSKDTGLDFSGILTAPAGSTNITPLTTLVVLNPALKGAILAMLNGASLDTDYMTTPVSQDVLQLSQQVAAILSLTANSVKVNGTYALFGQATSILMALDPNTLSDSNATATQLAGAATDVVKDFDSTADVNGIFKSTLNQIAAAITTDGVLDPASSTTIASVVIDADTNLADNITIPVVHLNSLLIGSSTMDLETNTTNKFSGTATVANITSTVTAGVNISDSNASSYTTTFTLSAIDTHSALSSTVEISKIKMTTTAGNTNVGIPANQVLTANISGTDTTGTKFETVVLNGNNLSLILTSSGSSFKLDMNYIYSKLPTDHPMKAFFAPGDFVLKISVPGLPTDSAFYDLKLEVTQ